MSKQLSGGGGGFPGKFKIFEIGGGPREGWKCPNCGRAHAPDVQTCPVDDATRDQWRRAAATLKATGGAGGVTSAEF